MKFTEQGGIAINPRYLKNFQKSLLSISEKKAPPLWKKSARHKKAKYSWVGTFFLFIIRAMEIIRLTVANVKASINRYFS
jgi:hypothetical protein